eukprot:g6924.t1
MVRLSSLRAVLASLVGLVVCTLGMEGLEGIDRDHGRVLEGATVMPERPELRGARGHAAALQSRFFARITAEELGVAADAPPEEKLRRLMEGRVALPQKAKCSGVVSVYMNGHPFHGPSGVDWDSRGNMWVTNDVSNSVLKVERTGGAIVFGTSGASKGLFKRPLGIVVNTHDVVYVTNIVLNNIVRIYPNGEVEEVVAGKPIVGPIGIETDSWDNVYVANSEDNKVLKIKYPSGPILLYASSKNVPQVAGPQDLGMDSRNNLFVANGMNNILLIKPTGHVSIFAGGAPLDSPRGIAVDSRDNVFVTNTEGADVFMADRTVRNVSGRAVPVPKLEDWAQTPAKYKARNLWGLAVNTEDTVFVADWNNNDLLAIAPPSVPSSPTVQMARLSFKWDALSRTTTFQAHVSFKMPDNLGGCALTHCSATSFPGGHTGYCSKSPCLVPGLRLGKTYYFYVRCENA